MTALRKCVFAMLGFALAAQISQAQTIRLVIDLSDAQRSIYHAKLNIPVKPGPFTLVYPKWIPGTHRPSGPILNVTGLRVEAGGRSIPWERDSEDMYAFHVNVPLGVSELSISFNTIAEGATATRVAPLASSNLLDLNWNEVVLYPQGTNSDDVQFVPSVQLPAGWKFGTALEVAKEPDDHSGNLVEFRPVSLTMLVDSPLIAGDHFRKIELTKPGETPVHVIDMVSESEAGLAMTQTDEIA